MAGSSLQDAQEKVILGGLVPINGTQMIFWSEVAKKNILYRISILLNVSY